MSPAPRTAFVFPGLNGAEHVGDHRPLLQLPGFAARWRLVANAFADAPGFADFDRAVGAGAVELPSPAASWVWRALALVAMQLAVAEALEQRGVRADWLCSYSIGDIARSSHAGCGTFAEIVALGRQLPVLPIAEGATAAIHSARRRSGMPGLRADLQRLGLSCSSMSSRFLLVAGTDQQVAEAQRLALAMGCRTQRLAACALHSPLQQPLADLLVPFLAAFPVRAPSRPVFSSVVERPLHTAEEIRAEIAQNVALTCDFGATIRSLHHDHGVEHFVDLGPGRHAQRFVGHEELPVTAVAASDLLGLTVP